MVFEVGDVAVTQRVLAGRGVRTLRVHEPLGEAVWVLPETTGGAWLDFVQLRRR